MYRYSSLCFLPSWMPSTQLDALRCFPTLLDLSCGVRGLLLLLLLLLLRTVLQSSSNRRFREQETSSGGKDG